MFSAGLLMPFDDFRRQIPERDKVDLDMISHCADRYRVSLIAAVLRWLQYTARRAVLVVSRDGFILWSRASNAALRTGAFFRTSGPPIAIPADSLAGRQDTIIDGRAGIELGANVWFPEPVREMTIFAEQYDFAVTLLLLENRDGYTQFDAEPEKDVVIVLRRGLGNAPFPKPLNSGEFAVQRSQVGGHRQQIENSAALTERPCGVLSLRHFGLAS